MKRALGVFVLLAMVHTWPLARDPVHLSRNDSADAVLNTWAIAWVAHQLPRDPRHLFDANIFHPERATLAYSEAMIVQGVMALPVLAAGGSPTLAYNVVLIAGFALTGFGFCILVRKWTGSWTAGYVSGSLAAFNAHSLVRLPHLQAQHVEFIALMLFALDRLMASRRIRDAFWLGAGFALNGLTSVYLLVFGAWLLLFAVAARARDAARRHAAEIAGLLALAAVTAVGILLPYLWVYYSLHQATGFERRPDEAEFFAATWANYLSTGARLHYSWWSAPFLRQATSSTFPGVTALILAGVALASAENRRDPRFRMCVVALAGCLAISWLPRLPWYPVLHNAIGLFRAVRVPAHMGQIVLLMLAVVAGYGVAHAERRWHPAWWWSLTAVVLCGLVNVEALRAPMGYTRFAGTPEIYREVAALDRRPIVELPLPQPSMAGFNASYMLNATVHWRPILNGYSGFLPHSYVDLFDALQHFPDDRSLTALHDRGVTHVVVHYHSPFDDTTVRQDQFDAIARSGELHREAQSGDIYVYRLK